MTDELLQISKMARRAIEALDWNTVSACAEEILRRDPTSAEGYFLAGKSEKAQKRPIKAREAFERSLELDSSRYDAAIELADQYSVARRNGDAAKLLAQYADQLSNSPVYLTLAGTVYTDIGMSREALPLFRRAHELQPGIDLFQANLAKCAVFLGEIEEARTIFKGLLERFPNHRSNHYQYSRLQKAKDFTHIEQMKEILRTTDEPANHNIPLYFALGKELEDLEQWDESFDYYKKAGDTVCEVTQYDVAPDIQLIDKIIEVCDADWLTDTPAGAAPVDSDKTPIFIVGLPRTGTTLTERILSSHSQVESLGETMFLQMMLRRESGVLSRDNMTPEMVEQVAGRDMQLIGRDYIESLRYRMGDEPYFIDKLPFNFLYLGFIAKAWPRARIVHLVRNPMDACFSMYKQVFTWAYKFSYSLPSLGEYYVAYDRLRKHWQKVLGDRLIEVEYEALVTDQEQQTRRLLDRLGLEFESACLEFDKNTTPSTTASSVQIREKVHSGSVNKWTRYGSHLQPLKEYLENAGIPLEQKTSR
jgi:tetratricopeptide (TPR) repeat protein